MTGDFRDPGCPVIMIVEDNQAVAESLKEILYSSLIPPPKIVRDYPDVCVAHQALEVGEMPPPDLVVLDPGLNETQGIDSLKQLLKHPALSDGVPIVVVSGTINDETAELMLSLGAGAYIPKGTDDFPTKFVGEIYRQCTEARGIRAIARGRMGSIPGQG